MAQRQERQLTLSDTLWQQLSIRFDDLVVEWLSDSLPVEGSPSSIIRLKATHAEVRREERSATTLTTLVQHSDTVSQQQEEASVAGMAEVESQACQGVGMPRRRHWLWLLPWLVLFLQSILMVTRVWVEHLQEWLKTLRITFHCYQLWKQVTQVMQHLVMIMHLQDIWT
jgi:hypothetical protein